MDIFQNFNPLELHFFIGCVTCIWADIVFFGKLLDKLEKEKKRIDGDQIVGVRLSFMFFSILFPYLLISVALVGQDRRLVDEIFKKI